MVKVVQQDNLLLFQRVHHDPRWDGNYTRAGNSIFLTLNWGITLSFSPLSDIKPHGPSWSACFKIIDEI